MPCCPHPTSRESPWGRRGRGQSHGLSQAPQPSCQGRSPLALRRPQLEGVGPPHCYPLTCSLGVKAPSSWCSHVCLPPSQLALDYGIKFMETSAKANINVENVSPRLAAPAPLGRGSDSTLQGGSVSGTGHRLPRPLD